MQYDVSFGRLGPKPRSVPGPAFRIALLGDFSGRAGTGDAATGTALAGRKPLRMDVDTLDAVLARLSPRLRIPFGDAGAVEVAIDAMDDFHPDQLVEQLPVFEHLLDLRRRLQSRTGFGVAAKEVLSWAGAEPLRRPAARRNRGAAIAADRKLSDFSRLVGRPAPTEAAADDLVRRLVGPFVIPKGDPRADELTARVDAALSDAMRLVLHHPDFQAAEALWRGVELLVRRLETGARLQVVLYDISAEELAADLASTDDLADTALHALLVEQPALDAQAGPLGLIAGLHGFELSPPHADLLGRMAQVAAAAGTPFVSGIGPDALQVPEHDWHPLTRSAWSALRGLPASAYLALATPRFLLRMPYGKRTDPIDAFAFEEFSRQSGLSGMAWGHPALLAVLLLGEAWSNAGAKMRPAGGVVGDLPVYVYRDSDGDQVALPCTERLMTERQAAQMAGAGVIPIVSMRGRPEVRVAGMSSLAGTPLAGRWAPVDLAPPPAAPPASVTSAVPVAAAQAVTVAPAPAEDDGAGGPARVAEEQQASDDLDALMAGLSTEPAAADGVPADDEAPAEAGAASHEKTADEAEDNLDALLASLGAEPPPVADDEAEADLDALLASLK